jgi:hypothetical protein
MLKLTEATRIRGILWRFDLLHLHFFPLLVLKGLKPSRKKKCVILFSLSSYVQFLCVVVECLEMTSVIYHIIQIATYICIKLFGGTMCIMKIFMINSLNQWSQYFVFTVILNIHIRYRHPEVWHLQITLMQESGINTFVNNFDIPDHAFTRSHFHCLRTWTQLQIWNRVPLMSWYITFAILSNASL